MRLKYLGVGAAVWLRSAGGTGRIFTVSLQCGDRRICRLGNFEQNGLQNRDRQLSSNPQNNIVRVIYIDIRRRRQHSPVHVKTEVLWLSLASSY